jgi:rhamnosyltransferase
VGPRFRDPREQRDAPFVRVAFPMSHKLWCEAGTADIECDFLISSGVLIPIAVLDDVGGMDDGLFIDNVDLDWSFRARSRGYALFGVCGTTMEHRLGDERRPIPGGHQQVVHGPVRLYFIMRNRIALYGRPHTPKVWIAQDLPRVAAKFFIFSALVGPRRDNLRFMVRGLVDGIRGRTGGCPVKETSR